MGAEETHGLDIGGSVGVVTAEEVRQIMRDADAWERKCDELMLLGLTDKERLFVVQVMGKVGEHAPAGSISKSLAFSVTAKLITGLMVEQDTKPSDKP